MFFRLLLLFLIIWFLIWIIKKQFAGERPVTRERKQAIAEDMIPCHYCGTHVPGSDGLYHNGEFYCSQEHANLDQERDQNGNT